MIEWCVGLEAGKVGVVMLDQGLLSLRDIAGEGRGEAIVEAAAAN